MPIQYDGRSLVPDLSQSLQLALGIAEQKKTEQREAEAAGLQDQIDVSSVDALTNPENIRILQRMNKLDPNAAQFAITIAQARDQQGLNNLKRESADASKFFQAFLDTKDPTERNRFLAQTIREREESGKDASKLRDLIGKKPDQQALAARRAIILAGDAETLADNSLDSMLKLTQLQNAQLERIQREREMAHGKYGDVAAMRDDFTKQSQNYIIVRDAYQRVQASKGDKTASGDMALLYSYMKLLDPTSAVRETEYANAENAAGVPERIRNLFNKAKDGQFLDDNQRNQFRSTADGLFSKQQATHDKLSSQFSRLAELRNFNPAEVVVDFSAPKAASSGGGNGGAAPARASAAPSTPAKDYREGAVMKNSSTGERWVVKGGQWQLLPAR